MALLEAVESGRDRRDVRLVAGAEVDLLEVRAEQPLVSVTGPLRQASELAGRERRDLAVDVEASAGDRGSCQAKADEPLQRVDQAAVLAHTAAETK